MSEQQPFDPRAFHAQFDIAMIVACSENGVIGRDGDLPWHLPADLKHFMRSTKGCPVIMGRKTFDSLDKPLPARLNIVVSRSMSESGHELVRVVRDLDEAVEVARASICEDGQDRPVWIAGGGTIYTQAIDRAQLVVRTLVHCTTQGDAHFPTLNPDEWRLERTEHHAADDSHPTKFDIQWWCRRSIGEPASVFGF